MSLLSRLADRLILCPTTDPIDPEGRQREILRGSDWEGELWGKRWDFVRNPSGDNQVRNATVEGWVVLKFPGTGGRAERAGPHPLELWPNASGEVWTVNPPGYGTSGGRASVRVMPEVARASWEFLNERAAGKPMLLVGNSLGCTSALHVAAHYRCSALLLRNPPPIHQLIRRRPRYNWWNFGAARWVANQFPASLDAVANAAHCRVPALFVQSAADRLVPLSFQQEIIAAYAGPKRVFVIPGADHHDPLPEAHLPAYFEALEWLRSAAES
jgi:pimeloyl-ACP methyl ester carboxylesterase